MSIKSTVKKWLVLFPHLKSRLLFCSQRVRYPKSSDIKGRIRLVNRGTVTIGDGCIINGKNKYNPIGCGNGCNIIAERGAEIVIGECLGMSNATIVSRCSVTVGDRVLIGGGVKIYDTDFHSLDHRYRGTAEDKTHAVCRPVVIGDDVFIGADSFILKGVTIGDRAVIGCGSVVTKDVSADEIWAGNPARCVRKKTEGTV